MSAPGPDHRPPDHTGTSPGTPAPSFDAARSLDLARRLADTADAITLARFRAADLQVRAKPDRTPVTDADLACEDAIRATVAAEAPDDAVLGEERGTGDGPPAAAGLDGLPASGRLDGLPASGRLDGLPASGRTWVIDPIDGTKNFSRGVPVWASLIALVVGGRPVLGMVSAPALGRRWWATEGGGAFTRDPARGLDEGRLAVSGVGDLGDAYVSTTDLDHWRRLGRQDRYLELARTTWESRAFGDFWQHCLVAEGAIDVAVDPEASAWDLAALAVIVEQAGGRFTDLGGRARHDGGSGLASNGLLHDAALAVVGV